MGYFMRESHFTLIADKYRDLRTTDTEPVEFIYKSIKHIPNILAADVGCGDGRYGKLFFDYLGEKLYLHCLDENELMLLSLKKYFRENDIRNFNSMVSYAEEIPLEDNKLDCVFCFNAVHHFHLILFLYEIYRVLKKGGLLYVYTRTRTQNSRNIWGKYFPLFNKKESSLYELDEFEFYVDKSEHLELIHEEFYKYQRKSSIEDLIDLAFNIHYSTFNLYDAEEFDRSIQKYRENLEKIYNNLNEITWSDENIMYVIKKVF